MFYILRDDDEEMSRKPCDDAYDGESCDIIIDHIPPKTNVIMEKQLFEDVSHKTDRVIFQSAASVSKFMAGTTSQIIS